MKITSRDEFLFSEEEHGTMGDRRTLERVACILANNARCILVGRPHDWIDRLKKLSRLVRLLSPDSTGCAPDPLAAASGPLGRIKPCGRARPLFPSPTNQPNP